MGSILLKLLLNIDMNTLDVTDYSLDINVDTAGTNYDLEVEKTVKRYENSGADFLAVAGETIYYTSQLYDWTGNVMLAATGADIAISNTGGVRSTGNIEKRKHVTLSQLYGIYIRDILG